MSGVADNDRPVLVMIRVGLDNIVRHQGTSADN